jgi:hypothetical protein
LGSKVTIISLLCHLMAFLYWVYLTFKWWGPGHWISLYLYINLLLSYDNFCITRNKIIRYKVKRLRHLSLQQCCSPTYMWGSVFYTCTTLHFTSRAVMDILHHFEPATFHWSDCTKTDIVRRWKGNAVTCVKSQVSILMLFSMIFRLDFWTVMTVCVFLFFIVYYK